MPNKNCAYCNLPFVPKRATQEYCKPICGARARRNKAYFGGHRQQSVGFKEKRCWICDKAGLKKPHGHHVAGKATAEEPQVELCPGCHELVDTLAQRNFLNNPHKVADLITLARLRGGLPDARTEVKYEPT